MTVNNLLKTPLATVLSIAGSDSSAGAGLQADLKTIHVLGGYALTVPTAITAQNSLDVSAVYPLSAEIIKAQLDCLASDYQIQAVKIGMLGNIEVLKTVISWLKEANIPQVVLDTVLISSSGKPLLETSALPIFIKELLPLATVITPNLPELNALLNRSQDQSFVGESSEMVEIAQGLFDLGVQSAVIKGGHSVEKEAVDYLITADKTETTGFSLKSFTSERLEVTDSHGTGCTLSSAIATELAKGYSLEHAVQKAKNFLFDALANAEKAQPCYKTRSLRQQRKGGLNHFNQLNSSTAEKALNSKEQGSHKTTN